MSDNEIITNCATCAKPIGPDNGVPCSSGCGAAFCIEHFGSGEACLKCSAKAWESLLSQARELETPDLERHARVSRENNHRCTECFTCAALTVLEKG